MKNIYYIITVKISMYLFKGSTVKRQSVIWQYLGKLSDSQLFDGRLIGSFQKKTKVIITLFIANIHFCRFTIRINVLIIGLGVRIL